MKKNLVTAITLLVGATLAVLNSTIMTPVLPVLMAEMDVSATTVQWLASLFMMVNALVVPMAAYIMGRFSARQSFATAMIFLTVGSILCAWAPAFPLLLVGRGVQAVASGILMPLVVTVLMLIFPVEKRGTVMGIYLLSCSVAPTLGPVVIGALTDTVGWRVVFIIITAMSLILLVASRFLLDDEVVGKAASFDVPSVVISVLSLFCILFSFSSMNSLHPGVFVVLLVVGVAGVTVFVRRQLSMDVPYLDMRVFAHRNYTIGILQGVIANCVLTATTVVVPLYLQNVCGASATISGFAVAPIAAGAAVASLVGGKLFDKLGPRIMAIVGSALMVASAAGLLTLNAASPVPLTSILATLFASGCMLVNTPMHTWALNALPNDLISHGNSVGSTVRQTGASLGTALAVALMSLVSAWLAAGAAGASGAAGVAGAAGTAAGAAAAAATMTPDMMGVLAAFAFVGLVSVASLVVSIVFVKNQADK